MKPRFLLFIVTLAASLAAASLPRNAPAGENLFINGQDRSRVGHGQDPKYWRENIPTLPPWPEDKNLIPLRLSGAGQSFDYLIDARNLTTGRDGVVRYTLIAESRTGARNLSFEGLRCSPSGHYRVYAYGYNGKFQTSGSQPEDWQNIEGRDDDLVHQELWRHYLCAPGVFKPRPHKEQLWLIKNGRVNQFGSQGFLGR